MSSRFFRRRSRPHEEQAVDEGSRNPEAEGDGFDLGMAAYLEFVGGSAAKFYAAVLEEAEAGSWHVRFNFGRIGFPRAWASKIEGVAESQARREYRELIEEKQRKGYEARPWPSYLELPGGERPEQTAGRAVPDRGIYISEVAGQLPPESGGSIGNVELPAGRRLTPTPEGGHRGDVPVLWVSDSPTGDVIEVWKVLARAYADTGLWPLIVEPTHGIDRMSEVLMDVPKATGADPFQLLRRWWHESVAFDEDEFDEEALHPFGRRFPGLARRAPGPRPPSIEPLVSKLDGHLGLCAASRPSRVLEAIGWMGPANYDINPTEQSAILDTWEDRFDAYLVGLGFDTVTLVVGRPPADVASASAIAAEHAAFCRTSSSRAWDRSASTPKCSWVVRYGLSGGTDRHCRLRMSRTASSTSARTSGRRTSSRDVTFMLRMCARRPRGPRQARSP
jgi:predicted DNA-binding WGR domain protein